MGSRIVVTRAGGSDRDAILGEGTDLVAKPRLVLALMRMPAAAAKIIALCEGPNMNSRTVALAIAILVSVLTIRVVADEPIEGKKQPGLERDLRQWTDAVAPFVRWLRSSEEAPVHESPRNYFTPQRYPYSLPDDRSIRAQKGFEEAMRLDQMKHRAAMQERLEHSKDPLR